MKFISLTRNEVFEIESFIKNGVIPERFKVFLTYIVKKNERSKKSNFKKICEKFFLSNTNETKLLKFSKCNVNGILFYPAEDLNIKLLKIKEIHNKSHRGRDAMFDILKSKIYGVNREEIMAVLKSCPSCVIRKNMNTKPLIKPIVAYGPRDRYIADLIDLSLYKDLNDGFSYLLVLVDCFSKFAICIPMKKRNSKTTKDSFEKIFSCIKEPLILHTDNGREFKNKLLKKFCDEKGIKQVFGRPRCPWIQGQVERLNRTIKNSLSATSESTGVMGNWVDVLYSVHTYNSVRHKTTNTTPFDAFFGVKKNIDKIKNLLSFNPESDELIKEKVRLNTLKNVKKMIQRSKWKNDEDLNVGNEVMLRTDYDKNKNTKRKPLNDNIDKKIYTILKRDKNKNYSITKGNIKLTNVAKNRLIKRKNLFFNQRIFNEIEKILKSPTAWLDNDCIDIFLAKLEPCAEFEIFSTTHSYYINRGNNFFIKKIFKNKIRYKIMPFFVKNHWICIKIDVENYELSYYDPLQRNRDFEMKEICLYIFWNDPFKIIEEKFLKQKKYK